MIKIELSNVSKRYGYQWIIRQFDYHFDNNNIYGISGRNGCGKSTLIKLLSGYLTPSEGSISHLIHDEVTHIQQVFRHISLSAPYTDLINEFTLEEMFLFHKKFKRIRGNIDFNSFESLIQLSGHSGKSMANFSSGMKQKIQLALAILSDTPVLLLDEPTSFLDDSAKKWYADLLLQYNHDRLVIIASNESCDLDVCNKIIHL